MPTVVLFGLPGAGKTFIGKILSSDYGYHLYDGDVELSGEMKELIKKKISFTDKLRDNFFERIIKNISKLKVKHKKLVVSQTFIKEKYRKKVLEKFPETTFILIDTATRIREARLLKRKEAPLDIEYVRKMVVNFEKPSIDHHTIHNNKEGPNHTKQELNRILFIF
ncbi:AAA family ATPase [Candidatus Roizmanbacteria bacterium]|nr:AAA family ATPase [Candidatus Roizmanbacteria bacterium]